MNRDEIRFLMELLMARDGEYAFARAILENIDDDSPRLIYSDYLEERGRTVSARLVRQGFVPGEGYVLRRHPPGIGSGVVFPGQIASGLVVSLPASLSMTHSGHMTIPPDDFCSGDLSNP